MTVDEYKRLIKGFLHDEMSAPQFEVRYLSAMKAEENDLGREAFDILQDLFEDVDAYTHEWPPAPGLLYVISEDQLRKEARAALHALEQLPTP